MISSNQDDEDDIYEDLPDFQLDETISKLEEANSSLQKRLAKLEDVIVDLNKEIKSLQREKLLLKSQNATLSTNISSLYKTAISEVNRKDNIINELRKENFTFLQNQQSKASPKNGQQPASSDRKARDYRGHLSHDRKDSQLISSSSKPRNDARDRYQVTSREQSYSAERRHPKSCSPGKYYEKVPNKKSCNPSQHSTKPEKSHQEPSMSEQRHVEKFPTSCTQKEKENVPCEDHKTTSLSSSKVNKNSETTSLGTKNLDRTFKKNLVIVDKSVPNTIYTKRLRKRILDEMEREDQASALTVVDSQTTNAENLSTSKPSLMNLPLANGNQVITKKDSSLSRLTTNKESSVSGESKLISQEKEESPSSIKILNIIKSIATAADEKSIIDGSPALVDDKLEPSSVNLPPVNNYQVNTQLNPSLSKLSTNKHSCVSSRSKLSSQEKEENSPSIICRNVVNTTNIVKSVASVLADDKNVSDKSLVQAGALASEMVAKFGHCNNVTDKVDFSVTSEEPLTLNFNHQKVNESPNFTCAQVNLKSGASEKQEVKNDSSGNKSGSILENSHSVSPTCLATLSIENISSNSGSSSLSTSLSQGHCFKKFKKDGKTRINPIYIGPRILTQKSKNDKKNLNLVRPVLSSYSNLTHPKSPKASYVATKTFSAPKSAKEPKVNDQFFSLFGKTPDKKEPFISSNSVFSENSLTNFSFLSSSDSPKSEKNISPETILKAASSDEKANSQVMQVNQPKQSPPKAELSESLQSREEQMASLFGDVSSDSSDAEISNLNCNKKIVKKSPGVNWASEIPNTEISSLSLHTEAKTVESCMPKTVVTPEPEKNPPDKTSPISLKITPNASDSSHEKRSFNLSQICDSITPFKNAFDSSSQPFTPAREILSPIPPTPSGAVRKEDSVTQEKSSSGTFEKLEIGGKINEVSLTVKSILPMQPKAEIIQSYLPKSTSTPASNSARTDCNLKMSENSANSSAGSRSFDLSKIPNLQTPLKNGSITLLANTPLQAILSPIPPTPHRISSETPGMKSENSSNCSAESRSFGLLKTPVMHTPFKIDGVNPLFCTPAQAILSPIPPTPQEISGKVLEKSESSDLFKIIKMPDSAGLPMLIKNNANGKYEDVSLPERKTEIDCKKEAKPSSFEDGNSNLSVNSISDKKVFLSPNSVSTPSCYTPFKTFSSDSLQSFMHTPARELLSPIPKTPLGSWDIDNEKTNSCDLVTETNPNNSLLPKESICEKDNVVIESNNSRKQTDIPQSSFLNEKNKLLLPVDKYIVSENKESCAKINQPSKEARSSKEQITNCSASSNFANKNTSLKGKSLHSESIKTDGKIEKISKKINNLSEEKPHDSTNCVLKEKSSASDKFSVFSSNETSKMGEISLPQTIQSTEKPSSIHSPSLTSANKSSKYTDKNYAIQDDKLVAPTNILKPERKSVNASTSASNDPSLCHTPASADVNLKSKKESELMNLPLNSEDSMKRIQTVSKTQGPDVITNKCSSSIPASVNSTSFKTSPLRSNISENNISISSVSEQIPFQRGSRKVRKVLVHSNNASSTGGNVSDVSLSNVKKFCPTKDNDTKDSGIPKQHSNVFRTPSDLILPSSRRTTNQVIKNVCSNTSTTSVKSTTSQSDKLPLLSNKASYATSKGRRAVLIPTDLANNIVRNLQQKSRSRKNDEMNMPSAKRERSPDKCEVNSKRFKGISQNDELKSKFKAPVCTTRKRATDSEQNVRRESIRYSRSSHRKSVDRSSRDASRHHHAPSYVAPSYRRRNDRSRSVSRCRLSYRRSVSRNLGSNYLARNESRGKQPKEPLSKGASSSVESSPPSTSSESRKENRASRNPIKSSNKPKKTELISKPSKLKVPSKDLTRKPKPPVVAPSQERERTASINSSLSSVSTFSDNPSKNEPLSLADWKLRILDLPNVQKRYKSVYLSATNKNIFLPSDPRIFRQSNAPTVESKSQGPQAASTPKMIKRKTKDVKLGDSTQVFSPIKPITSPTTTVTQASNSSRPKE